MQIYFYCTAVSLHRTQEIPKPQFDECRPAIELLVAEIRKLEQELLRFQGLGLPEQLIHGDLHYDNVMVVGDKASTAALGPVAHRLSNETIDCMSLWIFNKQINFHPTALLVAHQIVT